MRIEPLEHRESSTLRSHEMPHVAGRRRPPQARSVREHATSTAIPMATTVASGHTAKSQSSITCFYRRRLAAYLPRPLRSSRFALLRRERTSRSSPRGRLSQNAHICRGDFPPAQVAVHPVGSEHVRYTVVMPNPHSSRLPRNICSQYITTRRADPRSPAGLGNVMALVAFSSPARGAARGRVASVRTHRDRSLVALHGARARGPGRAVAASLEEIRGALGFDECALVELSEASGTVVQSWGGHRSLAELAGLFRGLARGGERRR